MGLGRSVQLVARGIVGCMVSSVADRIVSGVIDGSMGGAVACVVSDMAICVVRGMSGRIRSSMIVCVVSRICNCAGSSMDRRVLGSLNGVGVGSGNGCIVRRVARCEVRCAMVHGVWYIVRR